MPVKKYLFALCAAASFAVAADQEQPTPYDLIRPTWPLTWDEAAFDKFDTTITSNRGPVPKNRTPADYVPNGLIPDTLNQAYLDNINTHMSPIRVNQAGYLPSDPEKQFYYVGTATTFEVVDVNGNSLPTPVTGTFTSTGTNTSSDWTIIAGQKATTQGKGRYRYQVDIQGTSGPLQVGMLGNEALPTDTRLRIKVGDDLSSTFIISERVYSMVRSAALKFYGINRSGNSESWFHPASHTKDGMGAVVSLGGADKDEYAAVGGANEALAGTLQGGYYDCGDHLKESQTAMYAFMVSAVLASTNPDADDDFYDYNQGETVKTDGIPDMLREAKHGADFVLRAYTRAKGVIDDMALSVGDFAEHTWWGRPETQDLIPATTEGAASSSPAGRLVRLGELGANISGETAAGLALLSKDYQEFDPAFADSCLKVATEMYDFAKNLALGKTYTNNKIAAGWSSAAYNGNNEFHDDLSLAAICLFYATKDPQYLDDAVENPAYSNGSKQVKDGYTFTAGTFRGGWFTYEKPSLLKEVKNASWANCYTFALYAFYKLILRSPEVAAEYGISEEKRLEYAEDVAYTLVANLGDMSFNQGSSKTIVLPQGTIGWKNSNVSYDPIWYTMHTDQTWIYNRYQTGNTLEVLFYADVAKDLEGVNLPQKGAQDWKSSEMFQLGINQLNYMLGVNPWDVSFLLGVGDKNDAHPHHRAANPEGKNVPGAGYKYNPPVGALFGGVTPGQADNVTGKTNSWVPDKLSWEDYHKSETCIDAAATFVSASMMASAKFDRKRAPKVTVEVRHVSMDSALISIRLDVRGTAAVKYGTGETMNDMTTLASPDDDVPGVVHEIVLRDLKPGTTYYFYAIGMNAYEPSNGTLRFQVDSTQTPFSFTTLNTVESADIQNITVCNLTGDSAEIMWYTPNGEYESKLYWGPEFASDASGYAFNTGAGNADVSGVPTKFHYVKIGGLKEKTQYYFMVESNGVFANVDENGAPLKFTTPVTHYDFSVKTYQYPWQDMAMMNINVFNNEGRAFDSLTIRLYMRGTDEITTDIGMGTDICQAYDEAGYNKPCSQETKDQLERALRDIKPQKIEDTYDAASGTWQWYFPLELGSTVIRSSSRLRFDVRFDHRSPWPPYKDLMNEAPNKKLYCLDGGKWYAPSYEFAGAAVLNENPGDWSWMPHSKANGDYADYPGMPCINKDLGDDDFEAAPINPYTAVYRKDEFIWGYSPSKTEMSTKKAEYKLDVAFDPPFNVSNGSYVELAQTSKTVYVTGHAHITEGGYITKIWANGTQIDANYDVINNESYLSYNGVIIAHYNLATDMWDLNIPVRMDVGSNKIDITVFAGPDPECEKCTENGGCAFVNRNYYTLFTRPNLTDGVLTIKDVNGGTVGENGIVDPASNQQFVIYLTDKDKKGTKSPVQVKVLNGKKQDSIMVTLKEVGEGVFQSDPITAISLAKGSHANNQISFFAGDTIYVEYQDPDDEEDFSKITAFYAESNYPSPQKVLAVDTDCDNKADKLIITFSNTLDENYAFTTMKVFLDGMADTATISVPQPVTGLNEVTVPLDASLGIVANAAPTGSTTIFIDNNGTTTEETVKISDGIPPQLLSVTVLENPAHDVDDTVMIAFTEPVDMQNITAWPLEISGVSAGGVLNVNGKPITTTEGKSWQFSISGNTNGAYIPVGKEVRVAAGVIIPDASMNTVNPAEACEIVKVAETPKPVAVKLAEMRDFEGDGYPDEIYMLFAKKLRPKDMLDSFVVDWGMKSVVKSIVTKSDTSTGIIKPIENFWTLEDSLSAPYDKWLDSTTKITAVDTFSILKISVSPQLGFPQGATSGAYDGYGHITPRLGPEGGFFDKYYFLVDKCPPILMTGKTDSVGTFTRLTVTASEPLVLDSNETLEYIERKRASTAGVFLRSAVSVKQSGEKQIYTYNEGVDDGIYAGDSIRFPVNISRYTDVAGNMPTAQNPWRIVTGDAGKTKFEVTLDKGVTQANGNPFTYGAFQPKEDEYFRISVVGENGEQLTTLMNGMVTTGLGTVDSSTYTHSGPVFKVDISLPNALAKDTSGTGEIFLYDIDVKFTIDLFDNMGQFINSQDIDINAATVRNIIAEDGVIHLNLEWLAHDGEAPKSGKGKKIGTGAYIAKFDFKASETNMKTHQTTSTSDDTTKTFGFKRAKKK